MKGIYFLLLILFTGTLSFGQMVEEGVTLYGNEWVIDGQAYYKIKIAKDGIYKVDLPALQSAGLSDNVTGASLALFRNGKEVPIKVSDDGLWGSEDFFTFRGYHNKAELDKYLFFNGLSDNVNPIASLFNDTAAYFLTLREGVVNMRTQTMVNELTNIPVAEPYIIALSEADLKDIPYNKVHYSGTHATTTSQFDLGKGMIRSTANPTIALNCPELIQTDFIPTIRYRGVTNYGNVSMNLGHDLKININGTVIDNVASPNGRLIYANRLYRDTSTLLKSNANSLTVTQSHNLDLLYLGYLGAEYARSLKVQNTENLTFYLEGNGTDKYLEFDASGLALDQPYLTDSLGTFLLPGVVEAGLIRYKIPAFSGRQQFTLVVGPGTINTPADIQERRLKNFNDLDANYVIISHDLLMDGGGGTSAVDEYAAYRASAQGGGYRVAVVNVQDLYESFAYGVDYHPLSVKNFANFAGKRGVAYFFLVGRGRDYKEIRSSANVQTAINRGYGVPTYGDYGSDNLLVSESYHRVEMQVAVGRLPAVRQDEVRTYLNKIKVSDAAYQATGSNEETAWTKRVIQLNGGNIGKSDQVSIQNAQERTGELAMSGKFAALVKTFFKGTNQTIGEPVDAYFDLVNEGVSIVDYFGHGALTTLEYPIDFPDRYKNNPRFPILIIKGCKSGNSQRDGTSLPSKFLYESEYANSGFRAVIGSITDSYITGLSNIATEFYTLLGGSMYGEEIGQVFKETFSKSAINATSECVQQLFVGDPAIKILAKEGPDFTIQQGKLNTTPEEIKVSDIDFKVAFQIENIGSGYNDTLEYHVVYENAAKKIVASDTGFVTNPKSVTPVIVKFPVDKTAQIGENTIYIKIDPRNKINELPQPTAEQNNDYVNGLGMVGHKFIIKNSAIELVLPVRFSIIDTNKVTLVGFSQESAEKLYTYTFSMDTSDNFDTPFKTSQEIVSLPGHLAWSPSITLAEGQVYFWRIERDSLSPNEPALAIQSNFTYINNESGFSQTHNGQFRQNSNVNLLIEGGGNHMKFNKRDYYLRIDNGFSNPTNYEKLGGYREIRYINSLWAHKRLYKNNQDAFIVVLWYKQDSSLVFWPDDKSKFGSVTIGDNSRTMFLAFDAKTSEGRISAANFIEDEIGDNDVAMVFTVMREDFPFLHEQDWAADSLLNNGRNLFNVMEKYGANQIRSLLNAGSKPYSVIFDKTKGLISEVIVHDGIQSIETNLLCHADDASSSQIIGPASQWHRARMTAKDPLQIKDQVSLRLSAIHKNDLSKNFVIGTYHLGDDANELNISLSGVDAGEFPNIKYDIYTYEVLYEYNGHLDGFSQVLFNADLLPEATLLNNHVIQFPADSISQAEPFVFRIQSKNIGHLPMDSMLVKFTLRSLENNSVTELKRFNKLKNDSTDIYAFEFDTKLIAGNYEFVCEMNPDSDQAELYHGNNIFSKRIFIQGDNQNPLVDATFDGQRIFDGDIISSRPVIRFVIRDESKLFPMNDSSLFRINLKNEFGIDSFIAMNSNEVVFYPANIEDLNVKNEAVIEFRPVFYADGEYTIAVTARDVAGNQSGKYDFEKRFKIITKKSVSDLFNYPNPFSNATRFVYTLTGDELPAYYKIQIMSVSGKIVREITREELGMLKIGKHMTDYIWDGTDQYGDKLANGIYLYRMVVKDMNKKQYDKFDLNNNTGNYFDGVWGKLVIIR